MKVVVTDCTFESFAHEQAMCDRNGYELAIHQCLGEQELIDAAADADALFVQYAQITDKVMANLKRCKVIVRYGIGVDSIDLDSAQKHGIAVCNVPDYGISEVAEHAASLALSLGRHLPWWDQQIRAGNWPASTATALHSYSQMTVAIVGAGRIGKALIERLRPFGFSFIAYDPFIEAAELAALGISKVTLDEAFVQGDIVSLHLPLTPDTEHLVNLQRLQQMKSSAVLINTSRGALVDTHALAQALKHGSIAFAGIDVFEQEPLAENHPLYACDRAFLSPHIAYYSLESVARLQQYAAEEVERALSNYPLRCPV
ncbi:D-isomer specific 2-hydroxyacid dehydrogenase family protein [Neiella marina]|uniref:D-isomer specific 2-hydroxyacid dehydrogenase family protein n=1 Tax=Neiella marina TaxID=508461 RepID=A0A8J2XNQ4_9GAMM|nr:C-terminal binding protein [Neiella marina]GGA70492.1 D-isomer specific 2-hydroxyacid dehydrogenase family protein [Neiella marina]